MDIKYELTDNTIVHNGIKLYQIRALRDIWETELHNKRTLHPSPDDYANNHFYRRYIIVENGTLGGFVENEANLSQLGGCWLFSGVKVYSGAIVCEDAYVYNSEIYDGAIIKGKAIMDRESIVTGPVTIGGDAVLMCCSIRSKVGLEIKTGLMDDVCLNACN